MSYEEKKIEYSPEWKGPLRNRSCTDIPCLAIFIIFMACWVGVGFYAIASGDIEYLLAPVDSHGRMCGIDKEVADAPYLLFFDITKCLNTNRKCDTPQVCLKQCPTTYWYYQNSNQSVEEFRKNMICETGFHVENLSKDEMLKAISDGKCAAWYLRSRSIVKRCIPVGISNDMIDLVEQFITIEKLERARVAAKALAWGEQILDTAITTRGIVLVSVAASIIVCVLYLILVKWIAFPMVLIFFALLCGLLSCISYYSYKCYESTDETHWLVVTIVFGILAGLIVLIVLALLNDIRLACEVMKETSKAVTNILSSFIFPIFPWLFHLSSIVYFVVVGLYLYTIETTESWHLNVFIAIHIVGFLWFYLFISAVGEIILASAFATWYWTFNKLDVPFFTIFVGTWRTFRYHLGTAAFGSFLLTICRTIRILVSALNYSQTCINGARNPISTVILCCVSNFLRLFTKILKFMNRNAYIVCAVYGKGLCNSASDAMSLILRNPLRVLVLSNMVTWILRLGKFSITVLMGVLTWWYYTKTEHEIELWWVPTVFIVIGVYLVASIFLSVYAMAVDTIFLCFLEDCERHDGTPSKPYYMSRRLRQLLHK